MRLVPLLVSVIVLALSAPGHAQGSGSYSHRASELLESWDFGQSKILRSGFAATRFEDCSFADTQFLGGAFARAKLAGTELGEVSLEQCRGELTMERCEYSSMDLDYTTIGQSEWSNLTLRELRASHCGLDKLSFENSRFRQLNLRNCEISDIRFDSVRLYGGLNGLVNGCEWRSTRFYNDDFDDGRFEQCEFTDSRFYRSDFRSVRFEYCDFRDCRLDGGDLDGLTVDGISVKDAIEFYKRNR